MATELTPLETALRAALYGTAPLTVPSGLTGQTRRVVSDMTAKTTDHAVTVANSLLRQIFTLTPRQWQTLDHIGISQQARQLLEACGNLVKHYEHYPVNQRLDTIAAIPEYPADWRQWWLTNRNSHIGVSRPQDHHPKRDPAFGNPQRRYRCRQPGSPAPPAGAGRLCRRRQPKSARAPVHRLG